MSSDAFGMSQKRKGEVKVLHPCRNGTLKILEERYVWSFLVFLVVLFWGELSIPRTLAGVRWVWPAAYRSPHPRVAVLDGYGAVSVWLAITRVFNAFECQYFNMEVRDSRKIARRTTYILCSEKKNCLTW